jgi:hypothetical protein
MKIFIILLFLSSLNFVYSQVEGLNPLTKNPHVKGNNIEKRTKNTTTFDSTFIYIYDTLNLPFFDEFSTNKIQKYSKNYTDNDVYFDKKYKILKSDNITPYSKDDKFSSNPTYRKTYSIDGLTHTDIPLPTIQINIGEFNKYPVQYINSNVYPAYNIIDSLGVLNDKPDTIDLVLNQIDIIQDSAVQFFKPIIDANSLWIDNKAYHNFHFGYLPWSLGVMTFDGLDENGKAYELGTNSADYADYLTSKPLNLSTYTLSDSLYLSFLYQCGGYGEEPDSTDSLILEFYNKSLDRWEWIWSVKGNSNFKDFKVGHILIKDLKYYQKGFKFRFKNFGQKSGGFDHFNLDYVHLRNLSGYRDTLFKDFSWIYPPSSILKDYTSVPWDHYKDVNVNKMSEQSEISIRNGSNIQENNSLPGKLEIYYNNILEGSFQILGNSLSNGSLNYEPRTIYTSLHDFSNGTKFNPTKNGNKQFFRIKGSIEAQFPNYDQNDTVNSLQYFGNYYSYDDGTAEAAYGIIGKQSNLAVQFTPYESDSLIGIQTCFVESATDVSKKLFLLNIWNDNNGEPGELIYEDDLYSPRTPMYESENNSFHNYYFHNNKKIKVEGPFYIGWRQFDSERLNIGFDKNIINNTKNFYSLDKGVSWSNSEVKGSIMIRPIFSTSMDVELGINEAPNSIIDYKIYPNPTKSFLSIIGDFNYLELHSLDGKLLFKSIEKEINLEEYTNGVYLLKIFGESNKTFKIIKN